MSREEGSEGLGTSLRRRRLEQGLSLRRLAAELHIGASTLSDYENDRSLPSADLLTKCEEILQIPDGELVALRRPALAMRAAAVMQLTPPEAPEAMVEAPSSADLQSESRGSRHHGQQRLATAVSRSPLRFWLHSLGMAVAGAAVVLAAQNLPHLLDRSSASAGRQVKAELSPSPQLHAVPRDDEDPRDTGCDADAKVVSLADINVYRPGRLVIGQAIARYSPACKAIWTRFEPTKALNRIAPHARVTLIALRPEDQRRLTFTAPYEDVFMWGNMLLTSTGCITATVTITDPVIKPPATASTPCATGSTHP